MTKISPERLKFIFDEIEMAEQINKNSLEPKIVEGLRRYLGDFIPTVGTDWDIVLNELYPIVQNELPSIFFRNPRAFLKPRNKTYISKVKNPLSGKTESIQLDSTKSARTQEAILNYEIDRMKYKKEARKTLFDALISPHGVMWHGYKGDFGMTEENSMLIRKDEVFVKRVSPLRFIKDPCVTMSDIEESRWVGRIIDVPWIDFIEDDSLDIDKSLVKGFNGYGEYIFKNQTQQEGTDFISTARNTLMRLINFTSEDYQNSKSSKFVRLYEIYLRPTKKEAREGKNGYILLLCKEQNKPLRVNDWSIKAEGFPAKILCFNDLPDCTFGLSDIDVYKNIIDQKNMVINLQLRNAAQSSKVWVALAKSGTEEEDIEQIRRGENTIVLFEGDTVNGKMSVASAGGAASSELYLLDQRIQRNLEDKSGITDLKKGFLQSGEESATSVKIRAAGAGARPAYRQDIMRDFLQDSFLYVLQLVKQFKSYDEAVRIIGSLDLEWSENPSKEALQADVDVEIDAISMLPENPEKELTELQTTLNLMVQGLTVPAIQQKLLQEGKTINLAPIIEQMLLRLRIKDPNIFRNIEASESEGFVSVEQMREAKANVMASLQNQQIPFPPKMQDDHRAKLETYTTIQQLLQAAGQVSDALEQLIQVQVALLQETEAQNATPGRVVGLKKPSVQTI